MAASLHYLNLVLLETDPGNSTLHPSSIPTGFGKDAIEVRSSPVTRMAPGQKNPHNYSLKPHFLCLSTSASPVTSPLSYRRLRFGQDKRMEESKIARTT